MRRLTTALTAVGGALLALGAGVPDAPAARPDRGTREVSWTAGDAARYWTPERMASARAWEPPPTAPNPARPAPDAGTPAPVPQHGGETDADGAEARGPDEVTSEGGWTVPAGAVRGGAAPEHRPGTGRDFDGTPTVGRMYLARGDGSYFCTASVVDSPAGDLVLTAAHCLVGNEARRMAFVPRSTKATPRPYGMFPVRVDGAGRSVVYADDRYRARGPERGALWDVAFVRVGAGADGRTVRATVGANRLVTSGAWEFPKVRLIGHPASTARPRVCENRTTKFTSTDPGSPGSFLRIDCTGFPGGTSGGPFLVDWDERRGSGDVVGLIGGWKTGGPTADTSYSPPFGADVRRLYERAGGTPKG
ncbi:trypsin-like peptidase domain-containing protein [Streptomyces sp. BI20]|uniref:trypsin-like serine peptidase n=1 Tax=Streptomyces sp. BI20 TaxID=3403460 RepID=UPI003C7248F6